MLSSCAAALKLSCSATARNVRSWWSVSVFSLVSVSAIDDPGTTIGDVEQPVGGRHQRSGPDPANRPSPQPAVAADVPIRPAGSALSRVAALLDAGSFVERYGH